jgi:hypothetical protein
MFFAASINLKTLSWLFISFKSKILTKKLFLDESKNNNKSFDELSRRTSVKENLNSLLDKMICCTKKLCFLKFSPTMIKISATKYKTQNKIWQVK